LTPSVIRECRLLISSGDFSALRLVRVIEFDCLDRAAVVIEPVSATSLRKTGIFADKAGDFRRFPPRDRQTGGPETKSNARKAGISGPFSRFLGSLAECRTGWLAGRGGIGPRYADCNQETLLFRFSGCCSLLSDHSHLQMTRRPEMVSLLRPIIGAQSGAIQEPKFASLVR
jgi:hypothetical protein